MDRKVYPISMTLLYNKYDGFVSGLRRCFHLLLEINLFVSPPFFYEWGLRKEVVLSFFLKRFLILVLSLIFSSAVFSQQLEFGFQEQLEDYLESSFSEDESIDVEQLIDVLRAIKENPININKATYADFASLYFVTPSQINALLNYREQYGQILTSYELIAIDGFDLRTVQFLSEFVEFGTVSTNTASKYKNHEVMVRAIRLLENQAGYIEPKKYEGSPEKLYLRYRFSSQSVLAGFTAEKDAGESFFRASNKSGFDYNSGFLKINLAENKSVVFLGDYVVQFGQGLAAWQGFSLGKSSEVTQIAKFNQGIKPYSSTDENNYMRGVAASFEIGQFQFTPFISLKNFDANTDSVEGIKVFTSFQSSGYHRTVSEIEDKKSVKSITAGGNMNYEGSSFSIGLTGLFLKYEYPLNRRDASYNQYLFEGDHLRNLSVDYKWSINRLFLFGELANSFDKGMAFLNGALFQMTDRVGLSVLYRNIGKKYNAPLSSAMIENSRVNDEHGIYIGAKISPLAKLSVNMYADFFNYRWVKYTTAGPGYGKEYLLQANYNPSELWEMYCRYKLETKPVKVTVEDAKENLAQKRQSVRIQLKGNINASFTVKSRVELSFYEHDHQSSGVLISQDVGYHPDRLPFSLWLRGAWFSTEDYDSRIYAWENDMLYQFSVPAFYGKGCRFYLSGKVKICEKASFWVKASRSRFFDVESIGSGYSQINDKKRTELKMQLQYKF